MNDAECAAWLGANAPSAAHAVKIISEGEESVGFEVRVFGRTYQGASLTLACEEALRCEKKLRRSVGRLARFMGSFRDPYGDDEIDDEDRAA